MQQRRGDAVEVLASRGQSARQRGCAGLFASNAAAQDCAPLVARLRQTTVSIHVEAEEKATGRILSSRGSGVIVSESGNVLTTSHVLHFDVDTVNIRARGSIASAVAPLFDMTVGPEDRPHDLALLSFKDTNPNYHPARSGIMNRGRRGAPVCSFGFPDVKEPDVDFRVTHGTLGGPSGLNEWWTIDIVTVPGESGSPVFDQQGRLLGLRVAGRTDADGIYYMVPINLADGLMGPPPPPPGLWHLTFSGGYSFLKLNPNLPRELTAHDQNHPQDINNPPLLKGFAGSTPLDRVMSNLVEFEGGVTRRDEDSAAGLLLEGVVKVPLTSNGRFEIQQVNDTRDPSIGSFIYTKLQHVAPAFGGRIGVSLRPVSWRGRQLTVFGDIVAWNMTFEKGWSRFAADQQEVIAQATGVEVSPKARLSFERKGYALHLTGGATLIHFGYDTTPAVPSHWGTGVSIGGGVTFQTLFR